MAAKSALAVVARNSSRLRVSPSSILNNSSTQEFTNFASAATLVQRNSYHRLAPAAALLASNERAEHTSGLNLNVALGVFGSVSLAVLGLTHLCEDSVRCDGAQLQTAVSEEIEGSPVVADKAYNLLADSYRRQIFFNYERRIRLRSRPEKVFAYFASQTDSEGQPYMTPTDLMRAVVPVFPPTDSAVIREGQLQGERSPGELSCAPSAFFMLFDINNDGFISFPEYIFFQTLLSIPEKEFRAAFKMFDLDGNGLIDRDEFKEVMRRFRERTRQGLAHQNTLYSNFNVSTSIDNGGMMELFFGKDGRKQLPHEEFEKFLRHLHDEILRLEFAHYDYKQTGTISAHDFALSMIASADMDLLNEYLKRAKTLLTNPEFKDMRINPEDFRQFAALRKKLRKLTLAMSSYGAMNKADFQRAASQICNIPLSNAVVEIVFQIFDANQDGYLSSEEFLHAMERRQNDIANPKDTGLVNLMKCWWKCAQSCPTSLQPKWKL
ncbi:unnamed protein product [Calypogeia fissa]